MKSFEEYKDKDSSFWAFIKFISENLKYSKKGFVISYTPKQIMKLCKKYGICADEKLIIDASRYSQRRADLLNNYVQSVLMTAGEAKEEFEPLLKIHRLMDYYCQLPLNKQRGEMKQIAYFTAIINILAEKTIRELTGLEELGFDDDPRQLLYIVDDNHQIVGVSSRRFDGAFTDTQNPKLVGEIKEYYYNRSFGSRISDGVYETQLDGFEFNEIFKRMGKKVYHVLFIDSYHTWWDLGKSYLCRVVDALNSGIVDEVIVGREVFTRWPELLEERVMH